MLNLIARFRIGAHSAHARNHCNSIIYPLDILVFGVRLPIAALGFSHLSP